jgi:hypothetical protein
MLHGCWSRHAQRWSSGHRKKRRVQLKTENEVSLESQEHWKHQLLWCLL